ncbi:MAG: CFI-box-CTERM domain-containing protein [Eubacteriales bacterium]|nr:CFI-box-CTERM domain-containing protein [Eubacteriales bacterium]
MANTYLTALHGMPKLLFCVEDPLASFKKKLYADGFQKYYESNLPTYEALETGYNNAVDKEQFLQNMAEELMGAVKEKYESMNRRSQREKVFMDWSLSMVGYVFPGILRYNGNCAKPLNDALIKAWKAYFPQSNLSAAGFDEIEAGFHKKWCYITTAVCETFGKPDDCYELKLLRNYRDGYLMDSPDGEEIIHEYYDVAPTIVKRINKLPERAAIYQNVWDRYLQPCISMIEENRNEECRDLYIQMVRELQEKYFYNS